MRDSTGNLAFKKTEFLMTLAGIQWLKEFPEPALFQRGCKSVDRKSWLFLPQKLPEIGVVLLFAFFLEKMEGEHMNAFLPTRRKISKTPIQSICLRVDRGHHDSCYIGRWLLFHPRVLRKIMRSAHAIWKQSITNSPNRAMGV